MQKYSDIQGTIQFILSEQVIFFKQKSIVVWTEQGWECRQELEEIKGNDLHQALCSNLCCNVIYFEGGHTWSIWEPW